MFQVQKQTRLYRACVCACTFVWYASHASLSANRAQNPTQRWFSCSAAWAMSSARVPSGGGGVGRQKKRGGCHIHSDTCFTVHMGLTVGDRHKYTLTPCTQNLVNVICRRREASHQYSTHCTNCGLQKRFYLPVRSTPGHTRTRTHTSHCAFTLTAN